MKLGFDQKRQLYYVGWYCHKSGKVVYTWFADFQQAIQFMEREG